MKFKFSTNYPSFPIRFSEVEQLILVWWFRVVAKFSSKNLTAKTRYVAYFIFKLEDESIGLDRPLEAVFTVGDEESRHRICLEPRNSTARQNPNNPIRYPQVRDDQWSEVEIGQFYNDGEEDREVLAGVEELESAKRGLIFNGIEFRPMI